MKTKANFKLRDRMVWTSQAHSTLSFVKESNRIEGITRKPLSKELLEHERFIQLEVITIEELQHFVAVYEPGARLRDKKGLDVRVGNHVPPTGGIRIETKLQEILNHLDAPYETHVAYEILHPFTDCNGRSGRVLWAWQMHQTFTRPQEEFLHQFYYQALAGARIGNDATMMLLLNKIADMREPRLRW